MKVTAVAALAILLGVCMMMDEVSGKLTKEQRKARRQRSRNRNRQTRPNRRTTAATPSEFIWLDSNNNDIPVIVTIITIIIVITQGNCTIVVKHASALEINWTPIGW